VEKSHRLTLIKHRYCQV